MIRNEIKKRILILDGGIGSSLKKYKFSNFINLENPEIIKNIHQDFIDAGADIIETNTFNINFLTTKEKTYKICKTGANLALEVAKKSKDKKIFVAGSIGPTEMSLFSLSKNQDINISDKKNELRKIYFDQIKALIDCNIDFLLFETVYDSLNLEVGLNLAYDIMNKENREIPIIISLTIDEKGKIFSGEDIYDIINKFDCEKILAYGYNCSFGSEKLVNTIKNIKISKPLIIYPNAGTPDKNGNYLESPEIFVNNLLKIKDKANIIGGCCGVTPQYINLLRKKLK